MAAYPSFIGPSFLGIGAQKAGTSWLYEMLLHHPDIAFPGDKEIHFWDWQLEKGIAWYEALYAGGQGKIQGDITPSYALLGDEVIAQIATRYPQLKLVFLMRDPVSRAWSSALMAAGRAEMKVEECSNQWFLDHFHSTGSLSRGDYEVCIKRWLVHFAPTQLWVGDYALIKQDPRRLLKSVAAHIGADPAFYDALPDAILHKRVFAGTGEPIRPQLKLALQEIYAEKTIALQTYLSGSNVVKCLS